MAQNEFRSRPAILLQDPATFDLVKYGLRKIWPVMNLAGEGPFLDPPDHNHLCGGLGSQPLDDREPSVPCADCNNQKKQSDMHRLHCGHHLCLSCLRHRVRSRMPREHLSSQTRIAANRIYCPHASGYARTAKEKREVIVELWESIGWTCCREVITFSDYMHLEDCMPAEDGQKLWGLWDEVVQEIEAVGNGVILYFLEGYMEIELDGDGEVASSHYPGLDIGIQNPFQRMEDDPEGILRIFPVLARQWRVLRFMNCLPVAPSMMSREGSSSAAAVEPPSEGERRLHWLWG